MASGLRRSSGGAWLEEDEADDAEPTSPLSATTPETPCTEASPQTLDDRRYRASIHALEAEVDTLLSRAAGRGGAKARRDRDRELVRRSDAMEALQLENAELRNDLQAAGREVERLRAACASAQSDAERCARAAARAAERAEANELDEAVGAVKTRHWEESQRLAEQHAKAVSMLEGRLEEERERRMASDLRNESLKADLDLIKKEASQLTERCATLSKQLQDAESERDACKEEASRSSKHAERMTVALDEAERRATHAEAGNQQSRSDALKAAADSAQASDARTTAEAAAKRAETQRRSFEKQLAYARKEVENARLREEEQRERVAELSKTNRELIAERRKLEAREVDLEAREKTVVKRDAARRFRGLTDLKPMEVAELPEAALGAWRRK
jgi:chromosome segregation ATPase